METFTHTEIKYSPAEAGLTETQQLVDCGYLFMAERGADSHEFVCHRLRVKPDLFRSTIT